MSYPGNAPGAEHQPENPYTYPPATPAAEQPAAEQPAAEQPAREQPATEPIAAEQPALEQPAVEQPAYPPAEQPPAQVYQPGAVPLPSYPVEPVSGGDYGTYPTPTAQWTAAGGTPPPYSAPPQSAPPLTGPPISGPPISGPPMSGPPMSGPSTAGMPMYGPPAGPQPPRAKRGVAVPILAVLCALLLIGAIVMTALYIGKNGQYRHAKQTIAARETTISERDGRIATLQTDLQKTKDDLDTAKRDLSGSQNLTDELKHQKQVIKNCLSLSVQAAEAGRAGNTTLANKLDAEAKPICEEAFQYLAS